MTLSYAHRLICLIAVSMGLLQAAFEVALRLGAPLLLRRLSLLPIRQRERMLYLLQLAPLLLAVLLTGALCVPQYLRNETNLDGERVGWLCLLLGSTVLLWYGFAFIRGLVIAFRTMLFTVACRRAAQGRYKHSRHIYKDMRILILPGLAQRVALMGLFRPFISISEDLMADDGLSRAALEVVLDHERSHAQQFDNWKLLSLYLLPTLRLRLPGGRTWRQLWQSAAEWAADDDAVGVDSARVFLLAETLVAVARSASANRAPQIVCAALTCGEAGLAERIDRLLHRQPRPHGTGRASYLLPLLAVALGLAVAASRMVPWLHTLSERLLHLG